MNVFRILVCTLITLLFGTPALAESSRFYTTLQIGPTYLEDATHTIPLPGSTYNEGISFDIGFNAGGAMGFKMDRLRFDIEIVYHENEPDEFHRRSGVDSGLTQKGSGHNVSTSYLANIYFDFDRPSSRFSPYIGAGLGGAEFKPYLIRGDGLITDDDFVFAYKFALGVTYYWIENFHLTAEYNYYATEDGDFHDVNGTPFNQDYKSHNIAFGLRFIY